MKYTSEYLKKITIKCSQLVLKARMKSCKSPTPKERPNYNYKTSSGLQAGTFQGKRDWIGRVDGLADGTHLSVRRVKHASH